MGMEEIEKFLAIDNGYGDGLGSGNKFGSGGNKNYCGYGAGICSGRGYLEFDGYGSDVGDGDEYNCGHGDGYGSGAGYETGDGSGDGEISLFNGDKVYNIDNTPTIIKSVRGNVARGFILMQDFTLSPCYIVKDGNKFAHGSTLHEAYSSLREKLFDDTSEEEKLSAFTDKFPKYDNKLYPASELFEWHHHLTGSCLQGRKVFCKNKGIDINKDMFTVRQFVRLTSSDYGGDIISKLPERYGKTKER